MQIIAIMRAGCFTLIVFLMSWDCQCSVAFRRDAVVGLQCVILIVHGHSHLLFIKKKVNMPCLVLVPFGIFEWNCA